MLTAARRLVSILRPLQSRSITMSSLPFSKLGAEAELAILSVLRGCALYVHCTGKEGG